MLSLYNIYMYHSFLLNTKTYVEWGKPGNKEATDLKHLTVEMYNGSDRPEDVVCLMPGNSACGLGDSIWMISYLRDFFHLKMHYKGSLEFCSSKAIINFYRQFLPIQIKLYESPMELTTFQNFKTKIPSMFYWTEGDGADRSWVDGESIISRLYKSVNMQYPGLPNWFDFTPEHILDPDNNFYENLNLKKDEPYILYQWHSSGPTKNLTPATSIKVIRHLAKKQKVYVVGRLKNLDCLNEIPNVTNLSGKTEGHAEHLFTLASKAELIVCPDSGLLHLGEAYKIPCVCLLSVLPPSFIAKNYKIPAFLYGSGFCSHKPCGFLRQVPTPYCPPTQGYCRVFDDINLQELDKKIDETLKNRRLWRSV